MDLCDKGIFNLTSRVKTWQDRGILSETSMDHYLQVVTKGDGTQVSGRVSIPCWLVTPVANAPWIPLIHAVKLKLVGKVMKIVAQSDGLEPVNLLDSKGQNVLPTALPLEDIVKWDLLHITEYRSPYRIATMLHVTA